jgi:hypothetical protein
MRATLFISSFVVMAGCAAMPAQSTTVNGNHAAYEVDANSMVPIVMNVTRAQGLRVAVIDATYNDRASFIALPNDEGGDRTPMVIRLSQADGSERFAHCFGTCRSSVDVTPLGNVYASDAAKARATQLLAALSDSAWAKRSH